jgi:multidrug efflux pump subunit AcrA (membrane-fusion protein)
MSSLGKILLYIAVLGVLASAVGAWMLVQKYNDTSANLAQVRASVESIKKAEAAAEREKEAAVKEKDAVNAALTESKTNADSLQAKLDATVKEQEALNTSLATAKAAADKAAQDLKHFSDALGGLSPEEAQTTMKKLQDDKTAAETEQKILADQIQAKVKQYNDLKEAINKGPDKMPPGISGKVTFVNHAWNFVVLDVGLSNGIVPKGELIVYRGNRFLGKIKVTAAEENTSVADILPDSKGDIQAGDSVLN